MTQQLTRQECHQKEIVHPQFPAISQQLYCLIWRNFHEKTDVHIVDIADADSLRQG